MDFAIRILIWTKKYLNRRNDLLKELILDNSNERDIVFDPCAGSGSHLLVAKENNRQWIGVELNREYFNIASERVCE